MQKINSLTDTTIDTKLESLLLERKAPLSKEGMQKTLEELTLYMAGDRRFYVAFYPKEDAIKNKSLIHNRRCRRTDGSVYIGGRRIIKKNF